MATTGAQIPLGWTFWGALLPLLCRWKPNSFSRTLGRDLPCRVQGNWFTLELADPRINGSCVIVFNGKKTRPSVILCMYFPYFRAFLKQLSHSLLIWVVLPELLEKRYPYTDLNYLPSFVYSFLSCHQVTDVQSWSFVSCVYSISLFLLLRKMVMKWIWSYFRPYVLSDQRSEEPDRIQRAGQLFGTVFCQAEQCD